MQLFKKPHALLAVCNGKATDISKIPDEAFSSGMLGKGYGIDPLDGSFFSPVSGLVESVADARHAYTLRADSGLDILVHIGVDTVTLNGEGFSPLVKEGERIRAGQPIAQADLKLIREKGLSAYTAVLITEADRLEQVKYAFGSVTGGRDAVVTFRLK